MGRDGFQPKHGVHAVIRWSGFAALVRNTVGRRSASILAYHDPTPEALERHLRYLAPRHTFVRLADLVSALDGGDWRDMPSKPLVITFDDGWRGNFALLETFRKYGCHPTIYLCSQIADSSDQFWWTKTEKVLPTTIDESGYDAEPRSDPSGRQALNKREIDEMSPDVDFQAHTRSHPVLPMCSQEDAFLEISEPKNEIASLVGEPCEHFAFPYGAYSAREVALVREAGYRSARTIDYGWNGRSADPFALKVLGVPDDASVNRLAAALAGFEFVYRRIETGSWSGRPRRQVETAVP
jgi:peptidoglycan/xylan/chitin deacetylase (PgdA/CDA1 family)